MIYQYLILRYVHNISTEEFVNIGILMWLPHEKRVFSEVSERYSRLSCFFEGFDGHKYRNMIRRLQSRLRSAEKSDSVPCQWESITNAAEFVLSKSPSCFQWSELMGGIAEEPVIRLKAIFADIVDRHYEKSERTRRSEHDIYRSMHKRLLQRLRTENLHKEIHENIEVQSQHFGHTFKLGW